MEAGHAHRQGRPVGAHHRSAPPLRGAGGHRARAIPSSTSPDGRVGLEVESAAMESIADLLRRTIRDVPDFPKKGIVFKDITPVLGDARRLPAGDRRAGDPLEAGADRPGGRHRVARLHLRGARSPTRWAPASPSSASPASCPGRPSARATRSSTARTRSSCTSTRSGPGSGCWSWTTCSPPAAPPRRWGGWSRGQGAELVGYAFVVELSFLDGTRRLGPGKVDSLVTF